LSFVPGVVCAGRRLYQRFGARTPAVPANRRQKAPNRSRQSMRRRILTRLNRLWRMTPATCSKTSATSSAVPMLCAWAKNSVVAPFSKGVRIKIRPKNR